MKKTLLLIMLCAPVVLMAQNGVTISELTINAGTVTFNVSWNNDMPENFLWSDTVWVFVDYNDIGTMKRLPLSGATLTTTSWSAASVIFDKDGNDKGVWVVGNAKSAASGSFSATVQLLTATATATGMCAYASNYPPVGEYTAANKIKFTGTPEYDIVLKHSNGTTDTLQSGKTFLVPDGYTLQSFSDKTGAPGIVKCLPSAIHELKVSASSYCTGSSVTFALSDTDNGRTYRLYKDGDEVMDPLTATGGAATFLGTFAGAGIYTAKVEADAVHCAAVMKDTHNITETPLPTIAYLSGSASQSITQGDAITDITYTTDHATGVTSTGLPDGVDGTWSANTYIIAGTPTVAGTFGYTVKATHENGCITNVSASGTISVEQSAFLSTQTWTAAGLTWSDELIAIPAQCTSYQMSDGIPLFGSACYNTTAYNICPTGWRVPTRDEIQATPKGIFPTYNNPTRGNDWDEWGARHNEDTYSCGRPGCCSGYNCHWYKWRVRCVKP
jgi:hypothetical protein